MADLSKTPLEDLTDIANTMHERWDTDQRAGKLLIALLGELPKYDSRVTRIRDILSRHGDFGESRVMSGQGEYQTELTCRNIAPGLTLHDLTKVFANAKAEAEPGDEVAGNPSRWPDVRGIQAVVDAMNKAYSHEGH